MMPIVDSGVSLSPLDFALNDYLSETGQFHVLRMVAVQPISTDAIKSLEDIRCLQTQATTRGSGGLPNGIVAYCDLGDPASIQMLLDCADLPNLRGVHHVFESDQYALTEDATNLTLSDTHKLMPNWLSAIELLKENNLCLDMTATIHDAAILEAIASGHPKLALVVNAVVEPNKDQQSLQHWLNFFSTMAPYDNVYIKFSGVNLAIDNSTTALSDLLSGAIKALSAERVMLASGLDGSQAQHSFDFFWGEFVSAAVDLKARQRDSIFRSNAIRLYRL